MKTNSFLQKSIFILFMGIISGPLLNSCSQEDFGDQLANNNTQAQTRAARSSWHWKCPSCGFYNGGWKSNCSYCGKTYSSEHRDLIYTILDCLTQHLKIIETIEGVGGSAGDTNRTIEIDTNKFPARVPEAWYETSRSLKYYEELKNMTYVGIPEYAEGVEFGWYRTVRTLYPGDTKVERVGTTYDKWLISSGKYLTDQRGRGIKAGSKAAIKAFEAYRAY